uniref:Uncharacterized protein n=1 Tax=Fagus sylvatica TaxID=28930 RepID=A0A2N9IYV1_FAGSY
MADEAKAKGNETVELKRDWSKGYSRLDATHLNLNHYKDIISAYKKGHDSGGGGGCREGGGGGCREGSDGYSREGGGDSNLTGVRETCDCLVTAIR